MGAVENGVCVCVFTSLREIQLPQERIRKKT